MHQSPARWSGSPVLRRAGLALACAIGLAGCAAWREPTVPLRTIAVPMACATQADSLLVLLPGIGSDPQEFLDEGFVETVRETGLAADVLLVDAHRAYYDQRSIVDRLREDVVRPARARGYGRVWLAGVSLGGLGALLYAQASPPAAAEVDGLLLIAPYLGEWLTAQEIRTAGGLERWPGPATPDAAFDVLLWGWLKEQTDGGAGGRQQPILLGYGTDDRFAYGAEVLAKSLPASQVFTTPGGHDWPSWRALWRRMVPALPIARGACTPGPPAATVQVALRSP